MRIEPWQTPIMVMTGIIVLDFLIRTALRRWGDTVGGKRLRTAALGALTALVLAVGVAALGPDLADQLASVAAAVAGIVALWLTYRSYQALSVDGASRPAPDKQPEPATPAKPEH
ncbi:hypothetical protein ACI2K4_05315 [Micromonospora sp. NPDC050397]|uniref:hypothetical protein n=1 Tax=Micromonospora sp. NPDC050397 TaxID=3364279 RepID=UPI0038509C87